MLNEHRLYKIGNLHNLCHLIYIYIYIYIYKIKTFKTFTIFHVSIILKKKKPKKQKKRNCTFLNPDTFSSSFPCLFRLSNLCLCSQPEALLLCHFLSQLLLGANTISSIYLKPDLLEEVWAISPIAVSSLFILCFLYCCQFLFLHLLYVFLHLLCLRYVFLYDYFSLFLFLFQIWLHWPYNFRHSDTKTQRFEGYGDWGNSSRCWGFKCKRYTVHPTVHELMGSNKSSLDN